MRLYDKFSGSRYRNCLGSIDFGIAGDSHGEAILQSDNLKSGLCAALVVGALALGSMPAESAVPSTVRLVEVDPSALIIDQYHYVSPEAKARMSERPFDVGLNFHNSGGPSMGREQLQIGVMGYDLLRKGDATQFTFAAPSSFDHFQYYGISEMQPLDDDGTVAHADFAFARANPVGTRIRGHAETAQLSVSHPIIRGDVESLYFTGSVDETDTTNALSGKLLANERVRSLRLSGIYRVTTPVDHFTLSGIASFGFQALGARVNPAVANAAYAKFTLRGGYERQLEPDWALRLNAEGQYSFDRLPVSELHLLGGRDYGRAYSFASLLGDSAIAGSAEIAWQPHAFPVSELQGSEFYGFVDSGRTWYHARLRLPSRDADLTSAGAGIRIAVGPVLLLQLEAADPLTAVNSVTGAAAAGNWRFNVSLRARY